MKIIVIVLALTACAAEEVGGVEQEAAAVSGDGPSAEHPWNGERWTGGEIPYVIDRKGTIDACTQTCDPDEVDCSPAEFTDETVRAIQAAIDQYHQLTPIRFKHYKLTELPAGPHVVFYPSKKGNAAAIRGMPTGANCVLIENRTNDDAGRKSVLHELGHVVGLAHEQQRRDRAEYVTVNATCAKDRSGKLFSIDHDGLLVTPYDLHSIMQYNSGSGCLCHEDNDPEKDCVACTSEHLCDGAATCTHACMGVTYPMVLTDGGGAIHSRGTTFSKHDVNAFYRMYERGLGLDEPGDRLGTAIVHGDFDDDGYFDLAVGAPGEDGGRGAVFLWKGTGGSNAGDLGRLVAWDVIRPDTIGRTGFGAALAAGDFNNDGHKDLAIGAPDALDRRGLVAIYESTVVAPTDRRRLTFARVLTSETFGDAGEPDDELGRTLAVGNFQGDGFTDLAIGAPGRKVPGILGVRVRTGQVAIAYGGSTTTARIAPVVRTIDNARFGAALAVADHPNADDLVVGSPESNTIESGSAYAYAGSSTGLTFKQLIRPPASTAHAGMRFGAALATGRYETATTSRPQLAIGAPYRTRTVGSTTYPQSGAVYVYKPTNSLYNFGRSIEEPDTAGSNRFGAVLGTWSVESSLDRLLVGIPDSAVASPLAGPGRVLRIGLDAAITTEILANPPNTPGGARFGAVVHQVNVLPRLDMPAATLDGTLVPAAFPKGGDELVVGAPGLTDAAGGYFVGNFEHSTDGLGWTRFTQSTVAPE